ncbi:phosphoserine phosphatase SerB [Methermicoccus shengliensis]|uniref:phosphoserine phosphatase n=1 Tax=Methermicoccus shengliensis TaxID=660064 RepID=A0A832VXI7_9EURY|nr:phosphoserine phosphatase SerB [Methermicoccus shengliensis]HIH69887.1 phosphoserine phosphatase SerB [Methermicoccus shengliensis]
MTETRTCEPTQAQRQSQFAMIVFDMDSTLIDAETINELAKAAGVGELVEQITERAMRGEMDYHEALTRRVSMLKGLSLESALEAVRSMEFMKGARELVHHAKSLGLITTMVSCGFTLATNEIGAMLHMDHIISNELVVRDGVLTGEVRGPLTTQDAKLEALRELCDELGISLKQCIVIGDGANDLCLFREAGYTIAFNAKPVVKRHAHTVVEGKDLGKVIPILTRLCAEDGSPTNINRQPTVGDGGIPRNAEGD